MKQATTQSGARLPAQPSIAIDELSYPTLDRWMTLHPREFKEELDRLAALRRDAGTSPKTAGSIQAAVEALAALYKNRKTV